MLSYNQIIKLNKEFADNHYVIQNFGNGERWQVVDHNQDATFKYPLMWMEDLISPVQDKEMVYSFRIWFVTRVEAPKDRDGNSIYFEYAKAKSDMIQCAQDIIAYWVQDNNYPSMDIDRSVSIETFIDTTDDKLAGCYADIRFRETFNYDSCIIPMDGVTPPPEETCDPVTVYVNGVLFGTIASGGTTDIAVHDTAGNDVGTKTGSVQQIADVTTTVNGSSITNNKAETSKAITIRYADDSPVTVTTITDTEDTFIGEVPNTTTPVNTASIGVTGNTISYVSNDDGDLERGRETNFFNLAWTNPFGHSKAITGHTGGYWDEVSGTYKDVNGTGTTQALAFPDDILLDWKTYDQVGEQVFGIDYIPSSGSVATIIQNAPYTVGSFTGLYACNWDETTNFMIPGSGTNYGGGTTTFWDWPPISFVPGSGGTANRLYCSSGVSSGNVLGWASNFVQNQLSRTSTGRIFIGKYFTLTELGL